ncbi:MAG: hypothetical protein ABGZ24_24120, partial [Fuerstiella sp.]
MANSRPQNEKGLPQLKTTATLLTDSLLPGGDPGTAISENPDDVATMEMGEGNEGGAAAGGDAAAG